MRDDGSLSFGDVKTFDIDLSKAFKRRCCSRGDCGGKPIEGGVKPGIVAFIGAGGMERGRGRYGTREARRQMGWNLVG